MKYDRSKIKAGDVIALSHYKWASIYDFQIQMVRLFTQSEYTHVGLVVEIGGRLMVAESVTPVVRLKPLSEFVDDGFYWIPTNTPISEQEFTFLMSKVGKGRYSKLAAIAAYFNKLKIGTDDNWQCCEYVIAARKLSGLNIKSKAVPSDVVRFLQQQGNPVYFINERM